MERGLALEAFACIQRSFTYLMEQIEYGALQTTKRLFKACRLCNPAKVNDFHVEDISGMLQGIHWLTSRPSMQEALMSELPLYRSRATAGFQGELMEWWHEQARELPTWAQLAIEVALYQPTTTGLSTVLEA